MAVKPLRDRLMEKVVVPDDPEACWSWAGARRPQKTGPPRSHINTGDGWTSASRAAYRVFVGDVPEGESVLHTCDDPDCCNPRHLYTGDQAQNMHDARERGRLATGPRHPKATLTTEQVEAIRKDTRTQRVIGAEYGVDHTTVCRIRTGKVRKGG